MKNKQYTNPQIYVENVVVESGIALSYGTAGYAGQSGSVLGYDEETGSYDVEL